MVNDDFYYEFSFGAKKFELNVPIDKVLGKNFRELAHLLITSNGIPIIFHEELSEKLKDYEKKIKLKLEDEFGDRLLDMHLDIDEAVENVSQQFVMGHHGYGNSDVPSNDEIFADAYHELIHSCHYSSLLNMEQEHAVEMERLLLQKERALAKVHQTCQQSMELAVANVGLLYTDEQINQLAKQHIEATELEESKWSSSVGALRHEQKKDFRTQVMRLFEASRIHMTSLKQEAALRDDDGEKSFNRKQKNSPQRHKHSFLLHPKQQQKHQQQHASRREDSFTVHMGAQLKSTHNLRLISCNIFHLCAMPSSDPGQRFQTAISLYSDRLCGMVLLVDPNLQALSDVRKDFGSICEKSTDFHFLPLNEQMESIKTLISKNNNNNDNETNNSSNNNNTNNHINNDSNKFPDKLSAGDIYITRHSNLSQVHVVFHVVGENRPVGEATSRHPLLLAYRNVVKTAFKNDVRTLSLPLLLLHHVTESTTMAWCLRRAELVLKCLKGFVMEMSASEASFNLQLVVPPELSDDTFNTIATMVPSIFRMSNPLVASSQ